ncbi:hypothetical protein F140042L4_21570 [Coprococcus phoceensis]
MLFIVINIFLVNGSSYIITQKIAIIIEMTERIKTLYFKPKLTSLNIKQCANAQNDFKI